MNNAHETEFHRYQWRNATNPTDALYHWTKWGHCTKEYLMGFYYF